ncbi:hypothetical protein NCS57_01156900 [Fusarium keratoplasticum]|uniref:Uncharacterized protein n=1 Tax=Fusarium keratoplasticum TaxID=1328300 RepID=A0ACC0QL63_9HYPO|nr:hypothetical protein NCS57_01156900 [Fusarium keratoplasticum]KAI8657777.1 hypothetical protein NCS57_01156900 [Fusarium keratoplasticum]KAI8658738.1 hypothetical protein NCS55_01151400 [Fusarium keratoplasticum]
MTITTIRAKPALSDYTPLEEYQSQTPQSFVGGKPILHYHVEGAKAQIPKADSGSLALFPADSNQKPENDGVNGDAENFVEQTVDVFVSSENVTLFSLKAEVGITIPYPSIGIHGTQMVADVASGERQEAVWMQIELSDGGADDDEFDTLSLTVIPPKAASGPSSTQQMYSAMSNCSDLHPDPDNGEDSEEDDDRIVFESAVEHEAVEGFTGVLRGAADGGLPPPMPGSGGWITADNVHEYFDKDGNWLGEGGEAEEELGEGAGRVRVRDEVEGDATAESRPADDSENKRPRVE